MTTETHCVTLEQFYRRMLLSDRRTLALLDQQGRRMIEGRTRKDVRRAVEWWESKLAELGVSD